MRALAVKVGTACLALLFVAAFPFDAAIFSSLDPVDPGNGRPYVMSPGAPLFLPEPGEDLEDGFTVDSSLVGDVDLVLRTGDRVASTIVGPPSVFTAFWSTTGFAGRPGQGVPVPFYVTGSSRDPSAPARSPYWGARTVGDLNDLPVAVAAFADLDGDGFIGITLQDGDPTDANIEAAELIPVGRHLFFAKDGVARGKLFVSAGGPLEPLRVALTAAAYIGSFDPAFLGGNVPDGPAVFTRMPFFPETDPDRALEGGSSGPPPGAPDALIGFEVEPAFDPDPTDPRYGEAFTLATNGSTPSIDLADVWSGPRAGFAALRVPDPVTYQADPSRPLRPGIGPSGQRVLFEVLSDLTLATTETLRIAPVDQLGNVALSTPVVAVLSTGGAVHITAPDLDGDPTREVLLLFGAYGRDVSLTRVSAGADSLVIEGEGQLGLLSIAP